MDYSLPKMPKENDIESLKGYINRLYERLTFLLSNIETENNQNGIDYFTEMQRLSFQLQELQNKLDYSFKKTATSSGVMRIGDVVFSFGRAELMTNKTVGVAQSTLNIYSGPGESYSSIGTIGQYKEAEILGYEGEWARVRFGSVEGYSSLNFLNIRSSVGGKNVIPLGYYFLEPPAVFITPMATASLLSVTEGTIEVSGSGVINYLALGR